MATNTILLSFIKLLLTIGNSDPMTCERVSMCYACINSSCSWYSSVDSCIDKLTKSNPPYSISFENNCNCLNNQDSCAYSEDNSDSFKTNEQRQLAIMSAIPYIESKLLSESITQKNSSLFISCLNHTSWNLFFTPLKLPSFNDWLYGNEKDKNGQSFLQFYQQKYRKYPSPNKNTIGLVTIGDGIPYDLYENILVKVISIFYGLNVELLDPILSFDDITKRIDHWFDDQQLLTSDILSKLLMIKSRKMNKHLFSLIGLTMIDLYPKESWNFVYGQAKLSYGTAVSSFNRYYVNYDKLFISRSIKVLLHEIGHLFGLKHCVYFDCLMNGSNHIEEADSRPIHLCPICLHKLYFSRLKNFNNETKLNILQRYKYLADFFEIHGLNNDAIWFKKRLQYIQMVQQ
eukprot:99825_1